MKRKRYIRLLLAAALIISISFAITPYLLGRMIKKKMESSFNKSGVVFSTGNVSVYLYRSEIRFKDIVILLGNPDSDKHVHGKIKSISCKGINLYKALTKNEIDISTILIEEPVFEGILPFEKEKQKAVLSKLAVKIDAIYFRNIFLDLIGSSNAQEYHIRNGDLTFFNIEIDKKDTLSEHKFNHIDLEADEIRIVTADSNYSILADSINYYPQVHTLFIKKFSLAPNYSDYGFTRRYPYETDRFEMVFKEITFQKFNILDYIKNGNLFSSLITIDQMEVEGFRDKRKKDRHIKKPAFQQMIQDFPGGMNIDTLVVKSGNIVYKEHAEGADEAGYIEFRKAHLNITHISNLPVKSGKDRPMKLTGQAYLMGKGKLTIELSAILSDRRKSFHVNGSLSEMQIEELNPMLEKNAFLYAVGKLDVLNFEFKANDLKAIGKATMLYHDLKLTMKSKNTNDTTAIKEQFLSLIANAKVLNSNPTPNDRIREGHIEYTRDPEKFLFNYCFKSIFSGIKSTIVKNSERKKEG